MTRTEIFREEMVGRIVQVFLVEGGQALGKVIRVEDDFIEVFGKWRASSMSNFGVDKQNLVFLNRVLSISVQAADQQF